jgi:hypothetical protein
MDVHWLSTRDTWSERPPPFPIPNPQTNGHLKTQNALADDSECPELIRNNESNVLQASGTMEWQLKPPFATRSD